MKQNEMAASVSLSMVQETASTQEQAFFIVSGDCMEGAGIHDGDYVLVDFRKMPRPQNKGGHRPKDICLCSFAGPENVGVKEYIGRWGGFHIVGEHPVRKEGDPLSMAGYLSEQVFGVVRACFSEDGLPRWTRDISDCPADLPTVSTIHGDNCGEPKQADVKARAIGNDNAGV